MKKIITKTILVAALGLGLSSCNEFLTQVNPNETTVDSYWQDLLDTDAGLNTVYAALRNHYIYNFDKEAMRSDMAWPSYGRPVCQSSTNWIWYSHQYTNSLTEVTKKWDACYVLIFRANQVIEALDALSDEIKSEGADDWSNQMGQARFFRGLMYFYLSTTFNNGDIPLTNSVPKDFEEFYKTTTPSAEVIESYRADLLYAYENLPAKQTQDERPSAGAAATILGTSYLYEGNYTEAEKYLEDVINNSEYGYSLEQDMSKMFTTAGERNSESILEIEYDTSLSPELGTWDENRFTNRWGQAIGVSASFSPAWITYEFGNEVMDTLDSRNYYTDDSGNQVLRNVSLRCSASCAVVNDEQTAHYGYATVTEGWDLFGNEPYGFGHCKKYTNHDIYSTRKDENDWRSGKNVVLNRLSGVYLMLAECKAKTGNVQSALALVNAVRQRWALQLLGHNNGDAAHSYDEIDYTEDTFMDRLMYIEKPLELWNEGHMTRWCDLRRWGVTKERFEDLASRTYYTEAYQTTVTFSTGTTPSKKGSLVVLAPSTDTYSTIDYEYDQSAANFNASVHDYYDIPVNETINNPNI